MQGWPERFPGWMVMRLSTTSLTVQSYRRYPRGRAYQDWREMLRKERHDLDAVCIPMCGRTPPGPSAQAVRRYAASFMSRYS
jgi:hypothetical protein